MDARSLSLCGLVLALVAPLATAENAPPAVDAEVSAPAATVPAPAQPASEAGVLSGAVGGVPARTIDELRSRLLDIKLIEATGDSLSLKESGPIWVEFRNSPLLSKVVGDELRVRGYNVAETKEQSRLTLVLFARIQLDGSIGRRIFDIGETFEKIAAKDGSVADAIDRPAGSTQAFAARDAAVAQGWYHVGLFDKFLRNYFSVVALSDALGVRGGVNTWIAGDPRGFCLTNCEHWKHIHHWVFLTATVNAPDGKRTAKATSKVWMKAVDVQPVFDFTFETLIQSKF